MRERERGERVRENFRYMYIYKYKREWLFFVFREIFLKVDWFVNNFIY